MTESFGFALGAQNYIPIGAFAPKSTSPGRQGQWTADLSFLYICVFDCKWRRIPWATPADFGSTVSLVFSSDGDTNGVFYFIGTAGITASFTNPQSVGSAPLVVTASGVLGGTEEPVAALSDRTAGHFYTTNVASSWVKFDLGVGRSLVLTAYSYRSRTGFTGDFPTQWKLEGSNDDSTYTVIDGPRTVSITAQNQWLTTTIAGQTIGYRYFKWTQTAVNSASTNYFVFGEAELYGSFSY